MIVFLSSFLIVRTSAKTELSEPKTPFKTPFKPTTSVPLANTKSINLVEEPELDDPPVAPPDWSKMTAEDEEYRDVAEDLVCEPTSAGVRCVSCAALAKRPVICPVCHHAQAAHVRTINVGQRKAVWKQKHLCPKNADGTTFICMYRLLYFFISLIDCLFGCFPFLLFVPAFYLFVFFCICNAYSVSALSKCPTNCKTKHVTEVENKKAATNALRPAVSETASLAALSTEERTKKLQEEMKKAREASAKKNKEEDATRNAKSFGTVQSAPTTPQSAPQAISSPVQLSPSPDHPKRDYSVMTQEELAAELKIIQAEEAALKKRKLNVLFNQRTQQEQQNMIDLT